MSRKIILRMLLTLAATLSVAGWCASAQSITSAAKRVFVNGKWVTVEQAVKEKPVVPKDTKAPSKPAPSLRMSTATERTAAEKEATARAERMSTLPNYSTSEDKALGDYLYNCVGFLSDTLCAGRGTGTRGAVEASAFVAREFEAAGLSKLGGTWFHSFDASGKTGHNVVGMIPGTKDRYVVVFAYFDALGELGGKPYPGADSNASGVAALTSLAYSLPKNPTIGVILVALDAHNVSMAGSQKLYKELSGKQIQLVVNIDIIGSTLAPVSSAHPEFLMALGGSRYSQSLAKANEKTGLSLYFDYYYSRDFTDLFYRRISDQKPFLDHGIPAVMFTSGITMNTNKVTDTIDTLDFPVYVKRVRLISNWISSYVR